MCADWMWHTHSNVTGSKLQHIYECIWIGIHKSRNFKRKICAYVLAIRMRDEMRSMRARSRKNKQEHRNFAKNRFVLLLIFGIHSNTKYEKLPDKKRQRQDDNNDGDGIANNNSNCDDSINDVLCLLMRNFPLSFTRFQRPSMPTQQFLCHLLFPYTQMRIFLLRLPIWYIPKIPLAKDKYAHTHTHMQDCEIKFERNCGRMVLPQRKIGIVTQQVNILRPAAAAAAPSAQTTF